jgi:hypothetical protein
MVYVTEWVLWHGVPRLAYRTRPWSGGERQRADRRRW